MVVSSSSVSVSIFVSSSSVSVSVSMDIGIDMLVNVHTCGQPCSHLRSVLLYLIGTQGQSCLLLAVECVDISWVLF